MQLSSRAAQFLCLLFCFAASAWTQITTGTIVGNVADPQGLAISGSVVSLINERTGDVRKTLTNDAGSFTFPALPGGVYTLNVSAGGFQTLERKGINLTSSQYLPAGTITLNIGSTAETISVTAAKAVVQTASSENSSLLEAKQMNMMLTRGRDVVSLFRLLPGVAQNVDANSLGSEIGSGTPSMGGLRTQDNTISVDGQVSSDSDNVNVHISAVSMDAVEEVKVLASNYQAEYGRNLGAQVNIVSKSGTREFHGSASWFKRHEQFNANDFFNNFNGLPKPLYRYNNWAGTLGGPVFIPKTLNTNRDKLFFFYNRELWRAREPQAVRRSTMPTALERTGDYSQTVDLSGRLVAIRDPESGNTFPGNIVPPSRIDRNGQAILNLFPLPNFTDRAISRGNYNYQHQDVRRLPKRLDQLKVDYNITANDRLSARWRRWKQESVGYTTVGGFNSNWDNLFHQYAKTEDSGLLNYTRTLSPTLVNEASYSIREMGELGPFVSDDEFAKVSRERRGLAGLGQVFQGANPLGMVPAATFGGVPSAANIGYDARIPIVAGDRRWSLADNVTWIRTRHMIKAGFYYENNVSDEGPAAGCFSGCFDFAGDVNNPRDSRWAFSNALLGNYRAYSESNRKNFRGGRNWGLDWFVQDSWKVARNLTLEIGVRFNLFTPWMLLDGQEAAAFVRERYDPAKAVQLFRPAFDTANRRVGRNPITGALVPAVFIGAIVPGSGDPFNGMVTHEDKSYPNGWQDRPSVQVSPRFGFAWDLFGNGKTAIRGGFGITKQTQINSAYANAQVNAVPPVVLQQTLYYGAISALAGSQGVQFPAGSVREFERDFPVASVYNYSFGIQQDVGFQTVVGASYVGNLGRHILMQRNLNTLPYGTRFQPQSLDPTNPTRPLPDTFLAPYSGYATVSRLENSGISNYNSLQVTANRRFTGGFQFGAAYTYSKAMNLGDGPSNMPQFNDTKTWLYGRAGYDQTHLLVLNYTWDVPKLSRAMPHAITRAALDGWQLSGFTSFASGFPGGIGLATTDNADIGGGGDGVRVNVLRAAQLPFGERTFDRWFDPTVFARPARGDRGNAPKDVYRGPGFNNWDVALFKNFPAFNERATFQFRSEFYNMFNHTQFSGVDSTARFEPSGAQVNARLGQVISARAARVIQFALAVRF